MAGNPNYTYEQALADLTATYGLSTALYASINGVTYLLFTPPSTWNFMEVIAYVQAIRDGTPVTVTRTVAPPPPPVTPPPAEPPEGGTIFDTIINWIKTAISTISNWVTTAVNAARDYLISGFNAVMSALGAVLQGAFNTIVAPLQFATDWITATYNLVANWVSQGWAGITDAVSSAIAPVLGWITSSAQGVTAWVSAAIGDLELRLSAALSSIPPLVASLSGQISSQFTWLTVWLPRTVGDILSSWWDSFLAKVYDFGSWVGKLFDAVAAWFTVDVPGYSPRWWAIMEKAWKPIWSFLTEAYTVWFPAGARAIGVALGQAEQWVSALIEPLIGGFIDGIFGFVEQMGPIAPSMVGGSFKALMSIGFLTISGLTGMTIAGELLHPLKQLGMGNIAAMIYDVTNYKMLTGAFVGALAVAMIRTPATYYYNKLLRPNLPRQGDAAAMFSHDRISSHDFREILGYAGIADNWHEHYEDLAYRPMSLVALSTLCTSGGFDESIVTQVLTDRGINPKWRPAMLDLYRKKGLDTVKGMMSSVPISRFKQGYTDVNAFRAEMSMLSYTDVEIDRYQAGAALSYATDYISDLVAGWQAQVRKKVMSLEGFRDNLSQVIMAPERIDAFIMREIVNAPTEEPKGVGLSIAVTRFSTGETGETQYRAELALLGCPSIDIDRTVAATRLVYSHDYTLDLITAYRDAVRADNLTLDGYRQALLSLNLVPERVEGMVLIERARIKPEEKLTAIGPPGRLYLTDQGQIMVDTIRRRRQKNAITRDIEVASLIGLGMTPAFATAMADNDDAKLIENISLEPEKILRPYETAAGKIEVDTLRDARRRNTIPREDEITALTALGMPDYLSTAIADNDDVALAEKVPVVGVPAPPLYETETGKVTVDTIRRERRQRLTDRATEIKRLMALEMPDYLATAMADNDDTRLSKQSPAA